MKKRICALLLAVCTAFAASAPAYASNFEDIERKVAAVQETEQTVSDGTAPAEADDGASASKDDEQAPDDQSEETESAESADSDADPGQAVSGKVIPYFAQPSDYLYRAFNDVINLYVQEHLYEFTREEALEKFVYDMIKKHPEYYEMMINTLLGTMDPYSSFHEKASGFLSVKSPNAGFGIVVDEQGENVCIADVLKGSEAEAAGLQKGDIIKRLMGWDVSQMPWYTISEMLRKPYAFVGVKDENGKYIDSNPEVSFVVERGGEQLEFILKKGVMITNELNYTYYEEEGVAYIGISSFLADTLAQDFAALIAEISEKGITKLIVDLRDNGGGSLALVMQMAELFVDEGDTMCYLNTKELENPEPVLSTTPKTQFEKISVLVNENTASAAELMASILRNKAGAVLVGKTTFGKALGQSVYNFLSGDYITITTYEVLDANGESYNEVGLVPELEIDNVEMLFDFPELPVFNHVNYKEITPDAYSDACLALEKRLELLGYLRENSADGIWDDNTALAVYVLQTLYIGSGDGTLNDATVSLITDLVNQYKDYTYYEDSQFDVALIYHSSFSQAKRLIAEKKTLAKREKERIEENTARLEALAESEEAAA